MAGPSPTVGMGYRLALPRKVRLSLVTAMAGAAGLSAIANAIAAGAPATQQAPTRLGTSIQQSEQERDQARARQQRALDIREQALRASQARLKADLQSRQPTEAARPADAQGTASDRDATPYDDLSRIYQTMKPARAGPIFERLDLDVQTAIARRMRERSTALIMASMSPDAAVRLSMALAGKRVEERPVAQRAAATPAGKPLGGAPAPTKAPVPTKAAQQAPKPTAATPEKS